LQRVTQSLHPTIVKAREYLHAQEKAAQVWRQSSLMFRAGGSA